MIWKRYRVALILVGLIAAGLVAADEQAPRLDPPPYTPKPGKDGKPVIRITVGAPRGGSEQAQLTLIVPADGRIALNGPAMQWELSRNLEHPVRLMISTDAADEPIVDRIIQPVATAGIHTLNAGGLDLKPDTPYDWTLCIAAADRCSVTRDLSATVTLITEETKQ